jgi:hypothetical protein
VNNAVSAPPVAEAGNPQSVTLPVNSVSLDGSTSKAATGNSIAEFNWSKFSGPASGTIVSPNTAATTVNNLEAGTYIFRLRVTDNLGVTATDDVTITVNPDPNTPQPPAGAPTANAGKDETIPVGQATVLRGDQSKAAEGKTIASYKWVKFSGPSY